MHPEFFNGGRGTDLEAIYNFCLILLCLNNLSLEMKKKLINSFIWSVAVCGSETWTIGKK
jgi:hypothetical protein